MADKQYLSRYSNGKLVSASQYITEIICEKKAKIERKDLHYRFWISPEWQLFYRNQIASANKLVKKYDEIAVIRALNNPKASKIYSLRAPFFESIIQEEQTRLDSENKNLTINLSRKENIKFSRPSKKNTGILSKLKDMDNEC